MAELNIATLPINAAKIVRGNLHGRVDLSTEHEACEDLVQAYLTHSIVWVNRGPNDGGSWRCRLRFMQEIEGGYHFQFSSEGLDQPQRRHIQ